MATVMPDGNIHSTLLTDLARAPRETLPTMYDLPSEEPNEPGLPDEFHLFQAQLLRETFQPSTWPPEQVFVGSDLFLYIQPPKYYLVQTPRLVCRLGGFPPLRRP